MCHGAWGCKSHVDARWRSCRRSALNRRVGLVWSVVSLLCDLLVFSGLKFHLMHVCAVLMGSSNS